MGSTPALRMAAVALWWRSVISIAAVSRSTIPSLLASICSSAEVSMAMADLEGAGHGAGLGSCSSLHIAVERDASIFGVHSSVMSKQQIASHEGTSTLHALERALLGICEVWLAFARGYRDDMWADAPLQMVFCTRPGRKEGKLE
jgi:hypothetical protein